MPSAATSARRSPARVERNPAELAGERRQVSILFSDLRGFTTLSERMAPEQMAARLTEYFDAMTATIFARRGMVNDFIGDAILAVFGAPLDDPGARAPRHRERARDGRDAGGAQPALAGRGAAAAAHGVGHPHGRGLRGECGPGRQGEVRCGRRHRQPGLARGRLEQGAGNDDAGDRGRLPGGGAGSRGERPRPDQRQGKRGARAGLRSRLACADPPRVREARSHDHEDRDGRHWPARSCWPSRRSRPPRTRSAC